MDGLDDKDRQLIMARFAMHKVRQRDYILAVRQGVMSPEVAAEEYRKAMENYDQILGLAVTEPERLVNCQEDIDKGFYIE